ncbi:MAG: radical SAM family heme chaperone HemW [Thermotogota bacterium]|nr:radical SAM family heme chaperone HemW [Thermotogota bacterium]
MSILSDYMKEVRTTERIELPGMYFHIPFCKRKCDYCDFTTVKYDKSCLEEYKIHLLQEFELYKNILSDIVEKRVTIYFGGGSPSLFPYKYIEELIENIKAKTFEPVEVTLESNPWELTNKNLEQWRKIGITRLSIGVQSTDKNILNNVGRECPDDIEKKLEITRENFDNINMDFILGLPGESWKSVENNIQLIKRINPDHISYYLFDKDHETPLMRKYNNAIIKLPDDDLCEKWHDYILSELKRMNYRRYEISSWSLKKKGCLHNLNYWNNGNYIGCGISAGGHINNLRYVNHVELDKYKEELDNNRLPYKFSNENSFFEEFIEKIFMGLRLQRGVEIVDFTHVDKIKAFIKSLLEKNRGLLEFRHNRLKLTNKGFDLSRSVFESIILTKEKMNDVFRT